MYFVCMSGLHYLSDLEGAVADLPLQLHQLQRILIQQGLERRNFGWQENKENISTSDAAG